jgi:prepilin-type N-terminal cleavage/methylation domain-containing protein
MLHFNQKQRSAFSLLELLVVIMIVSMVYYLGFEGVKTEKKRVEALTPDTLKTTLIKSEAFEGEATLLCGDQCKQCYWRASQVGVFHPYKNKIDLENLKVYTVDKNDLPVLVKPGRYHDRKICLKMDFYQNGSTTQMIIENQKGIYFLPSYFGEPKKAASLEEAKVLWTQARRAAEGHGDFY